MRNVLIFFAAIALLFGCKKEVNPYLSAEQAKFASLKVKEQQMYLISSELYDGKNEDSVLIATRTYNKMGQLIHEVHYTETGDSIDYIKTYTYNGDGYLTAAELDYRATTFRATAQHSQLKLEYDDNNYYKTIETTGDMPQKISCFCNPDGKLSRRTVFNGNNQKQYTETYVYDGGKLINMSVEQENGSRTDYNHKYDVQGLMVESFMKTDGAKSGYTEYEYDGQKLLRTEKSYNAGGHNYSVLAYEYYHNGLLKEKNMEYPFLKNIESSRYYNYRYLFY